jgi:ATP-dependent RNA helicase SUPV3L1/SUV3
VLLWRPGGRNENQRNDNRRPGNRAQGERRNEAGEGQGRRENRGAPAANRDGDRKREGGQRPDRGNRPDRNDRQERGERKDRPDRNDRGGKPQAQRFEAKPPRKEKPIDPDSPFAKLAALKEQMKK